MPTLKAHGLDVQVDHTTVPSADGLLVWEITAIAGETTHKQNLTVGAVDGARPNPPSATELQTMLDVARHRAADEAGWKELVRINSATVT